ncbi:hypothetical protein EQ500_05595, partial [Lactobacillus sp. XV13L]|nr:hypothetical protein [Lactobacillus sp. XV13L]
MKKAATKYEANKSNSKFIITLILALFFGCLTVVFGYTTLTSGNVSNAKINKVVAPYRKQLDQKQQQIDDLKATNEGLKQQVKEKQDKVIGEEDHSSPSDFILKNYSDTSKQFVSQIIGPHTAAQIRKNLGGIAT